MEDGGCHILFVRALEWGLLGGRFIVWDIGFRHAKGSEDGFVYHLDMEGERLWLVVSAGLRSRGRSRRRKVWRMTWGRKRHEDEVRVGTASTTTNSIRSQAHDQSSSHFFSSHLCHLYLCLYFYSPHHHHLHLLCFRRHFRLRTSESDCTATLGMRSGRVLPCISENPRHDIG